MIGTDRATEPRGDAGTALVAVLWVLMLLALVVTALATTTRADLNLARNVADRTEARLLADGGVDYALLELLRPRRSGAWVPDGRSYSVDLPGGDLMITLQDEAGKVDLNRGSDLLLRSLFQLAGLDETEAETLLQRVADFRDSDELPRERGAEAAEYRAAGFPYGPNNGAFRVVEELQRIPGVTAALFARLAPYLTVYSGRATLDPTAAPEELLRLIPGLNEDDLQSLIARRGETGGSSFGGGASSATGGLLGRHRGSVFTIEVEAVTEMGGRFRRRAVVRLRESPERPYEILDWRQVFDLPAEGESPAAAGRAALE